MTFFENFISSQMLKLFDTKRTYFYVVLIFLTFALFYVCMLQRDLMEKKTFLNCTKKISVEEHDQMKKENTAYHLEKLRNSQEFKVYAKKKLAESLNSTDYAMDANEKIIFSDED